MAKKITWWAAAEIIGISDRTMHRWRDLFEEHRYDGLMDQRKGKQASHWIDLQTAEEVLVCIARNTAILTFATSTRSGSGNTASN
jgi:transposase